MLYKAPRGTADILPQDQPYWRYIEEKAASLCQRYGYGRIDTPLFEDARLFVRSIGEDTDIVEKEMYTFQDRSGMLMTLRPEGTAPVCRAYLEHGMHNLPQPVRLYYIASAFRYERPQAGRYRQHLQFGFETIGDADPALDAEIIDMASQFYTDLGLGQLHLLVNSIGCQACCPSYVEALTAYYSPLKSQLCPDCQRRLEQNPLRLLDCKKESCLTLSDKAPRSLEYLCPPCQAHFESLERYLKRLSLSYSVNHRLVRGLDYYTRTVFEVQPQEGGAQSTLGGGGRYDNLIEHLGGKPTPGVGFATGLERIALHLKKQGIMVPGEPPPRLFVAYLGERAKEEAVYVLSQLRRAGLSAVTSPGDKSLKAQLKQADALGAPFTLILGEEEMNKRVALLRDMAGGEQRPVPLASLIEELKLKSSLRPL